MKKNDVLAEKYYDVIKPLETKNGKPWVAVPISFINSPDISKEAKLLCIMLASNNPGWKSYETNYAVKLDRTEKTTGKYLDELCNKRFLFIEKLYPSESSGTKSIDYQYYIDISGKLDKETLILKTKDKGTKDVVVRLDTKATDGWVPVPLSLLYDERLSIGARILCIQYCANKPGWKSEVKQYVKKLKVSKDKISDFNTELTRNGYLMIKRFEANNSGTGRITYQYFVDITGKQENTEAAFFPNTEGAFFPNTDHGKTDPWNLPPNNINKIKNKSNTYEFEEEKRKSSSSSSRQLRGDFENGITEEEESPNTVDWSIEDMPESNLNEAIERAEAWEFEKQRKEESINCAYQNSMELQGINDATPTSTFNFSLEKVNGMEINKRQQYTQQSPSSRDRKTESLVVTDEIIIEYFLSLNSTREEAIKFIIWNDNEHKGKKVQLEEVLP